MPNSDIYWGLDLSATDGEILKPGIYKNATRCPFNKGNPGLDFSGCGRGNNTLKGEFEILELKVNEDGEVVSLAVNFVQNYRLFGSFRFNSLVPIEKGFLVESLGYSLTDYPDIEIVINKTEFDENSWDNSYLKEWGF